MRSVFDRSANRTSKSPEMTARYGSSVRSTSQRAVSSSGSSATEHRRVSGSSPSDKIVGKVKKKNCAVDTEDCGSDEGILDKASAISKDLRGKKNCAVDDEDCDEKDKHRGKTMMGLRHKKNCAVDDENCEGGDKGRDADADSDKKVDTRREHNFSFGRSDHRRRNGGDLADAASVDSEEKAKEHRGLRRMAARIYDESRGSRNNSFSNNNSSFSAPSAPETKTSSTSLNNSFASEDSCFSSWSCPSCRKVNFNNSLTCVHCRKVPESRALHRPISATGWRCPRCTFENPISGGRCGACGSSEVGHNPAMTAAGNSRKPAFIRSRSAQKPTPATPTLASPTRVGVADLSWQTSQPIDQLIKEQVQSASAHVSHLCAQAKVRKVPFTDEEFPPCKTSLYGESKFGKPAFSGPGTSGADLPWMRPSQIPCDGTWSVIPDRIRPEDIIQGVLGDCWFLSALSVLADRRHLIDRLLLTKTYNPLGAYAVRFFHDGDWQRVVVDDHFPTQDGSLIYGRCFGPHLWVPIIEKAYAKLHGSYAAIVVGQAFNALFDLTGAPCESIDFTKTDFDPAGMWHQLLQFKKFGFLMAAACGREEHNERELEKIGLVHRHAYSLMDVFFNEDMQLVKLRNPWGRVEWKGEWGCNSRRWTPEWRARLTYSGNDGTFWMTYSDFLIYFTTLDVCKEQDNWTSLVLPGNLFDTISMTPTHMFELLAPTATRLFAVLVQRNRRSDGEDAEYASLGLLVNESRPGAYPRPVSCVWPTLGRVCHTDFTTHAEQPRYLLLPYSTSAHSYGTPFTFLIYAEEPIQLRPVPCNSLTLRQLLPAAVTLCQPPEELQPRFDLYFMQKESAVFVVAVNRDPAYYAQIRVDASASSRLTSSRGDMITWDVLPPSTIQLVAIMTQSKGVKQPFIANTRFRISKMSEARWRQAGSPTHKPALSGGSDLHAPQASSKSPMSPRHSP